MYICVHVQYIQTSLKQALNLKKRLFRGFPGGSAVKNPPATQEPQEDTGLIPRLGRTPGEGHGNPRPLKKKVFWEMYWFDGFIYSLNK